MGLKETGKFKDSYLRDSKKLLSIMNNSLLTFEKNPLKKTEILKETMRAIHTLKSTSSLMNFNEIARLCHELEDVVQRLRLKELNPESCIDIVFKSFDELEKGLHNVAQNEPELQADEIIAELKALTPNGAKSTIEEEPVFSEDKTDSENSIAGEVRQINTIEVKVEKLNILMRLAEELLICKMKFDDIKEKYANPEITSATDTLTRLVSDMQYNIMQSRLVPIDYVFSRFPRMARDLAKNEKKIVNIEIKGGEIELDREMIEQIGEPLVHLVRNAVDHAIEIPKIRQEEGKRPEGTIRLSAQRTKDLVVINVEDDGTGIDWEKIKDEETLFSGISTTKQVTPVSGRGLGLNIVKRKVESIAGSVHVTSPISLDSFGQKGTGGTCFTMQIPLSMAVVESLLIEVSGKTYAIPVANVERLINVKKEEIKGLINGESIVVNEQPIPITRLSVLFKTTDKDSDICSVVIVRKEKGGDRIGIIIDSPIGTDDLVIKPLNKLIKENKYFAGCSIIGSGDVIMVLDVADIVLTNRQINKKPKTN